MKKILGSLLVGTMVLTACGGNEETASNEANNKTTAKPVTAEETSTAIFENGTLETEKYSLTISKAELIQSPMENKPGLFVTFTLTNKTENEDIVPGDVINDLMADQENETSRIGVSPNYHFLDAFGDDVETYNKMVGLSNSQRNALLPGKTIEFVEAYTLDNDTFDVTFIGLDPETFEEVGQYKIELTNENVNNL